MAALAAPHASVVMDARSGEILYARNHDTRLHPASLTKMMTLYIAFEAVKNGEITLDTPVTISANAASEVCSCLGLRAGQKIALRYLIRASAVRSGNDAATAIGEAISGSEAAFAARMTRTARAIGMTNTTFRNAHGLTHREHLSTARDMTLLARQLFFDYPQYYNLFSRRSTDAGVKTVLNTNRRFLDSYQGADGIKTGYTNAAGFNLVGSAERGGKRIIATVFGGTSVAQRNAQMTELLDMGFARAATRVALNPPSPPRYGADGDAPRRAGRTVRVDTVLARSPLPRLRPLAAPAEPPEELIAALQTGIGAALEEVQSAAIIDEGDTAADAAGTAEDGTGEDGTAADIAAIVPEIRPEDIVPDARPSADVAQAPGDPGPVDDVQVVAGAMAEEVTTPLPRPGALAVAHSDADAREGEDGAAPVAEDTRTAAAPETGIADADAAPDTGPPAAEAAPAAAPEPQILLTSRTPPPRPAEGLVLAAAPDAGATARPARSAAPSEVITRHVSTSQAQVWGINVGRYGSRFEAERVLMQTALAESTALAGTLRKVQPGAGGFDATFQGMTRDQADTACRRLQARDRLCFAIGP